MREEKRGVRARTRAAAAWAVSALLALHLAGAALPTALAQDVGGDPNQGGRTSGMAEEPEELAGEGSPREGQGGLPQAGAPSGEAMGGRDASPQAEEEMGVAKVVATSGGDDAPLVAQSEQDPVPYVDESGGGATCIDYKLIEAEPEGDDHLALSGGWYVVKGQVTATKRVEVQGDAHLILCDDARLDAQKGVHNHDGKTLSVYGQAGHTGVLNATGEDGGHSAGIGGNENEKAGTFNAYGATVTATGGEGGAGIGGGFKNDGGTVLVRGEKTVVTAVGGESGAGIGGGNAGYTGEVTIEDGTVTAQGGSRGAGIGGGNGYGADSGGGTVTIKGGTVNATGGENGAGIGGANGYINNKKGHTAGADVLITGGEVIATGGAKSPGIGTGSFNASGGFLTVKGGNVTATGREGGAGIGGGYVNRKDYEEDSSYPVTNYPVTITGGIVTATADSLGAGIGGGDNGNGVKVIIGGDDTHVEATGGDGGAGIGSGDEDLDPGSFEVSGGTVIATAGRNAAGIGTGKTADGMCKAEPKITISGGDITAKGNTRGAGIGGGEFASGGTIKITGGTVRADGSDQNPLAGGANDGGAGIGAGGGDSSGKILTNGGTVIIEGTANVEAKGGKWCAGIGGGRYGDGAEVTISGNSEVKATGGEGGAGIGGGRRDSDGLGGAGRKVTIDGGTVTAEAGSPSPNGGLAEAIGYGSGWNVSGDLTVYDAARVLHGSDEEGATISTAAQRIEKCRDPWAQISPCDHKDAEGASTATLVPTSDRLHHVEGCTQCLYIQSDQSGGPIEHDHAFDAGGACACGVHAHRVSFDKNADRATGTMESPYVVEQTTYALPVCDFARDGYAFAGWNTKAGGNGKAYADQADLPMEKADVALFAQWRPSRFGAITGVAASYVYNGKPHQPKPAVTGPEGQALQEGADYRLEYEDNVSATANDRRARVRVVGVGEYEGVVATVDFDIEKSTPVPPVPPRAVSATASSITVAGEAGCEYSLDNGETWRAPGARSEVAFSGLRPGTAYDVVGRVRATANTNPSAPSEPLHASTEAKPSSTDEPGGTDKPGDTDEPGGTDEPGEGRLAASASYRTHLRSVGWVPVVRDGATSGTTGESRRMEAIALGVGANVGGGVVYQVHAKHIGWTGWARDGEECGTTGESRRIEAVRVQLDGELAGRCNVYYRVHVRHLGWMAWTCDGEPAGTVGESRRIEAIQVVLVERGGAAPAEDYGGQAQTFPLPFRQNGPRAG